MPIFFLARIITASRELNEGSTTLIYRRWNEPGIPKTLTYKMLQQRKVIMARNYGLTHIYTTVGTYHKYSEGRPGVTRK